MLFLGKCEPEEAKSMAENHADNIDPENENAIFQSIRNEYKTLYKPPSADPNTECVVTHDPIPVPKALQTLFNSLDLKRAVEMDSGMNDFVGCEQFDDSNWRTYCEMYDNYSYDVDIRKNRYQYPYKLSQQKFFRN